MQIYYPCYIFLCLNLFRYPNCERVWRSAGVGQPTVDTVTDTVTDTSSKLQGYITEDILTYFIGLKAF